MQRDTLIQTRYLSVTDTFSQVRASCAQVWRTLSTPAAQQYYLQRFKEKQEEERKESGTERQRNSKGGRNWPDSFPAGRRVADSQPLATTRTMPSQV